MDNGRSIVVGVFEDQDRASQAVEDLRAAGFSDDQIGYVARGGESGETTTVTEDRDGGDAAGGALGGAVTGGILGSILGAAAALLIPGVGPVIAGGILGAALTGAAVGAAAGGLIGALTSMGVPEEEARYYQGEFEAGRTIVTVQAGNRQEEAIAILRRNGAYDATTQGGGTADYDTAGGAAGYATTTTTSTTTGTTGTTGYAGYTGETRTANEGEQVIELREEEVVPIKQAVQAGEVEVRKVVHEEQREIPVNVAREEVRIERHAVDRPLSGDVGDMQDEVVRVPVYEEQVELQRQGRVAEEVVIGKEVHQEQQTVTGTVRREDVEVVEDADVRARGDVDVDVDGTTRGSGGRM